LIPLSPACLGTAEKGGDPEIIRESQRRRYANVSLVDKVVQLDADWRNGVSASWWLAAGLIGSYLIRHD
jgi:hypothetical protein